jgi:hypothetical protein
MAWGCAARLQAVRDCQHGYGPLCKQRRLGGGQTEEVQEGSR